MKRMLGRKRHPFDDLHEFAACEPAGQGNFEGRESLLPQKPEGGDKDTEDDENSRGLLEQTTHG